MAINIWKLFMAALRKMAIMYGSSAIMASYFSFFSGTSFRMFLSDRVMDLQNESVVDFFFTPLGFKCNCNKRVKQPGKKNTNLMSHLKNVHKDSSEDEYRKSKTKEQAVLSYPKVNKPERPKSAPNLRLKKTRKPLFLQLETTKALKNLKIVKKISEFFLNFFFEVSGKSHSAENVKGETLFLMLDALDALKMKF